MAVPSLAWLLPLLGRVSPIYDTFCVYPATAEEQAAMIHQLEAHRTRLALVHTAALDGRAELTFARTHPEVSAHLETSFEAAPPAVPSLAVFRRPAPAR
jgi:hypothetical protein